MIPWIVSLHCLSAGCSQTAVPFDAQDVLVVQPIGAPLRIRLHITVDGGSFRQHWQQQVNALFDVLDSDKSQKLESKERLGLPWPTPDATLDRKAVLKLANERSPPLEVVAVPPAGRAATGLFILLDENQDGVMDTHELAAARRLIEKRDFDDNGVLTVDELVPPYRPETPTGPLVVPLTEEGEIPAEERVRLSAKLGTLAPPAKIDFECWLPLGRSTLKIDAVVPNSATPGSARVLGGRILMQTTGVKVQAQVMRTSPSTMGSAPSPYPSFVSADQDKNGYLDATELKSVFPPELFRLIDSDGNDRVFSEEYHGFIARRERVRKATLSLYVSDLGQELFNFLDTDGNGRLTKLELENADRLPDAVKSGLDRLTSEHFPHELHWQIGPAGSSRPTPAMLPGRAPVTLGTEATDLPMWFVSMDLNRDGIVDSNEFLGPPQQFKTLDSNHDGLLSSQECRLHPNPSKPLSSEKSKS